MRHVGAAQRSYDSSSYVELHSRSNKGDPHGLWGGVAFSPWIVPIEDGFVAPFRIDNIDNKQYGEPKPRLLGALPRTSNTRPVCVRVTVPPKSWISITARLPKRDPMRETLGFMLKPKTKSRKQQN